MRINEFADAFSGWMKEYQQKQFGRCGDAGKREQNTPLESPVMASNLTHPPLSNEQRPIQE